MAVAPFRKQGGGTEAEFRGQSNVEVALNGLRSAIILDGVLIENVTVGINITNIAHKLGRTYRGYIICSNSSFATVALSNVPFDKSLFINLLATSPCVISLWVF